MHLKNGQPVLKAGPKNKKNSFKFFNTSFKKSFFKNMFNYKR